MLRFIKWDSDVQKYYITSASFLPRFNRWDRIPDRLLCVKARITVGQFRIVARPAGLAANARTINSMSSTVADRANSVTLLLFPSILLDFESSTSRHGPSPGLWNLQNCVLR